MSLTVLSGVLLMSLTTRRVLFLMSLTIRRYISVTILRDIFIISLTILRDIFIISLTITTDIFSKHYYEFVSHKFHCISVSALPYITDLSIPTKQRNPANFPSSLQAVPAVKQCYGSLNHNRTHYQFLKLLTRCV